MSACKTCGRERCGQADVAGERIVCLRLGLARERAARERAEKERDAALLKRDQYVGEVEIEADLAKERAAAAEARAAKSERERDEWKARHSDLSGRIGHGTGIDCLTVEREVDEQRDRADKAEKERDEARLFAIDKASKKVDEVLSKAVAAEARVERLRTALAELEPKIRFALHAAQDPLADMVRRCLGDRPHDHAHLTNLRSAMRDLTDAHGVALAALADEPATAPAKEPQP